MPRWLAPNVITLLGIVAIYINILTVLIYVPDLVGPGPSWIYFTFAFGIFFYQTMDNIDGKQARATGTSSPLGELFDHGIDSLNCCLGGLVQSVCMGLGSSQNTAVVTFMTCIAMYMSTWETYHTHVLYLGYLNGPTEGIIVVVATMLISGFKGIEFWDTPIYEAIPFSFMQFLISLIVPSTETMTSNQRPLKDLWVHIVIWSILCGHVPICLYNVYMHKRSLKGSSGTSAGERVRNIMKEKLLTGTPASPTSATSSSTPVSFSTQASNRDTSRAVSPVSNNNDNDKFIPRRRYHRRTFDEEDSFFSSLLQLFPLIATSAAVYFWLTSPFSIIISQNHLVLFTLSISLVFGRMTTTIILAHLTRQPFPFWSAPMYPLFAGSVLFSLFQWPSWSVGGTVSTIAARGLDKVAEVAEAVAAGGAGVVVVDESIEDVVLLSSKKVIEAATIASGNVKNYSLSISFELIYLWIFFLYLLAYFSVYSTRVIRAITEFLGISAFTVRKQVDLMGKDL